MSLEDDKYFDKELHNFLHKKYKEKPIDLNLVETKYTKYQLIYVEYLKNDCYSSNFLYKIFSQYPGCYVSLINNTDIHYYSIYVYKEDLRHIKNLLSYLYSLNYIDVVRRTKCVVVFNNYANKKNIFKFITTYQDDFYPALENL
jgi:hypothetical protein